MISVNHVQRPAESPLLFNKKIIQVGAVDSKVPQMNDAGDVAPRGVLRIVNLLVDRIKVAMGVTDN
jgi:hypothetical protein